MAGDLRRLAAIVAADVVGYSRLMGRDESGTVARLREHRKQRLEPVPADHHLAGSINAMNLKDRFGDIETDCRNRLHG